MTSSHRQRFFGTNNDNTNMSMNANIPTTVSVSRTGSSSSHRSATGSTGSSPPVPDQLLAEFSKSESSLDLLIGSNSSGFQDIPSMDRSWTAGTTSSRRRLSGSSTSSSPQQPLLPTHHHSSPTEQRTGSPPLLHSYSSNNGPRQRGSPLSIKRNISGDWSTGSGSGSPELPYLHYPPSSSSSYINNKYKPHPYQGNNWNRKKQWVALCGFGTLAILAFSVYQHDAMLQSALRLKQQEVDFHIRRTKELQSRVATLRQTNIELHEKLQSLTDNDNSMVDASASLEAQRQLFHWEHANLKLQTDIQAMCRRLVKEKFGHGPKYYVQMKLGFDPHDASVYPDQTNAGDVVIIQTASIEDMPHSVYLFLEQVDHHLYDHTTFYRNAPHLVQAGPLEANAHVKFRHHPSLNSVLFQEYAPETMTHKQYTLGYGGRPGGPDFYVNMRDNSVLHGPKSPSSSSHYNPQDNEADPCFAKIVNGFEVMERLHQSSVLDPATNDNMVYPVLIENMKVLPHDFVLPHDSDSSDDEDEE